MNAIKLSTIRVESARSLSGQELMRIGTLEVTRRPDEMNWPDAKNHPFIITCHEVINGIACQFSVSHRGPTEQDTWAYGEQHQRGEYCPYVGWHKRFNPNEEV